jgi:hypothetical protein
MTMKRYNKWLLAVVAAVFFPAMASAAAATYTLNPEGVKVVCASGTCDAPTLITQFAPVNTWSGFYVTVVADSGQTLSGAGTISCYGWDTTSANVVSFYQDLGLAVSTASVRAVTLVAVWIPAPRGAFTCVPTGVTVGSGGVTLYISGGKAR